MCLLTYEVDWNQTAHKVVEKEIHKSASSLDKKRVKMFKM